MTIPDKHSGICLHISSLPGPFGIGDIGESAHDFVHTLRAMGQRVWQFLPLGPVGFGNSPYQPLSIYAGNEMLIAIGPLIEGDFLSVEEAAALQGLATDYTDYAKVTPLKDRLLTIAAQRFLQVASAKTQQAFAEFLSEHDDAWLHNYALFRVLKTLHSERAWPEWAPHYVRRDATALDRLSQSAAADIHCYKVKQFWFYHQWQQLREVASTHGVTLMGDIPIYIALDSADAWEQPHLLEISRDGEPLCVAGVPPDYFSADGQLWGNPLYDWDYHEQTEYRWWKDRLSAALTQMDLIRLDHFRGFESYWSIPAESATAREGEWRSGPADKLFHALQSSLGELPLIAEDLGIITDEVRAFLHRLGLPGMKVLQFMVGDEGFGRHDIPYNAVCYTGTHDNDTTVGWFFDDSNHADSSDQHSHFQSKVLSNIGGHFDSMHLDMIQFALNTEARLCMIPLQDILGLGSDARMNTPGTTTNNWRWRLSEKQHQDCISLSQRINHMVASSGRRV